MQEPLSCAANVAIARKAGKQQPQFAAKAKCQTTTHLQGLGQGLGVGEAVNGVQLRKKQGSSNSSSSGDEAEPALG